MYALHTCCYCRGVKDIEPCRIYWCNSVWCEYAVVSCSNVVAGHSGSDQYISAHWRSFPSNNWWRLSQGRVITDQGKEACNSHSGWVQVCKFEIFICCFWRLNHPFLLLKKHNFKKKYEVELCMVQEGPDQEAQGSGSVSCQSQEGVGQENRRC